MVRKHIITETEKQAIKEFIETGKRLEGFRILKFRLKKINIAEIEEQIRLIKAFLEKIKSEK